MMCCVLCGCGSLIWWLLEDVFMRIVKGILFMSFLLMDYLNSGCIIGFQKVYCWIGGNECVLL